jgi:hypothetical protein
MIFHTLVFLVVFYIPCDSIEDSPVQVTEKVYLHVDRSVYNSGDDLWFKAYVIDASTKELSFNTNNLHVELISPDSEIIRSSTIRMEGGTGNGDFQLRSSLPSGRYRVRAYTNFMRNFDDRLFYYKEITIINPDDENQEPDSAIQFIENSIELSFFPEGGSLIDNVSSVVAFKAVDALGKGCEVSGELFSTSGDLITKFTSTHFGMGYFTLKPENGLAYYAIVKSNDGNQIKSVLPGSFPEGMTISAFTTNDRKLFITINTNEASLPSLTERDFALSCNLPDLFIKTTVVKITSLVNNFLLPADGFPDGIIRITLSETDGLPLCERLVYLQKNSDVYLKIATDKMNYNSRDRVSVAVSLSGDSSFSGDATLSLSAAETGYTDNSSAFPTSIASWFLLESDVRGPVEEPSYYFDPSNKDRMEHLDLLLMTQGWSDFKWKYESQFPYKHEIGYTVSGRVKRLYGNNPTEGVRINFGLLGENINQFYSTETDSIGEFSFEELDISSVANMFIPSTGRNERMQGRIFIDSLFYEPPGIIGLQTPRVEKILAQVDYTELRQEAVVKLDIKKKYKLSDTINIGEVIIAADRPETLQEKKVNEVRRYYGEPDKEMIVPPEMDNFAGDVFNMISGRIPGIMVRRGTDANDVKIIVRNQGGIDGPGALILLDGRLMDTPGDISNILSLPAFMIDRIDVLDASPMYGMSGAYGVVNIITRTGMRRGSRPFPVNSANIKVKGFDAPRIFYSPKYDAPKRPAYQPDTRTTIFWEPYLIVEKNSTATLEYFNADNPTTINVTVEGITAEGIPVSSKVEYKVK